MKFLLVAITRGFNALGQFVLFVLVARITNGDEFGFFSLSLSLAISASFFCLLGQHSYLVKNVPSLKDGEFAIQSGRLAMIVPIALSIIVSSACASIGFFFGGLAGIPSAVFFSVAVFLPMTACADLLMNLLRAFNYTFWGILPRDFFWRSVTVVIVAVIALFNLGEVSAFEIIALLSVALLFANVIQLVAFRKSFLRLFQASDFEISQKWMQSSFWLWCTSLIGNLGLYVPVVILSFAFTATQTGEFFAAFRLAGILSLPLIAIDLIAAPKIAQLYGRGDIPKLQAQLRQWSLLPFAVVFPGLVGLGLFGQFTLGLFGAEHSDNHAVLLVLAISYGTRAAIGPVGTLLAMTGKAKASTAIWLMTEFLAYIGLYFVASAFGMLGAAIIIAIGITLFPFISSVYAVRALGIVPGVAAYFLPLKNSNF